MAPSRANAAVHSFSRNVTVTLHLSADDLLGRDERTLALWTFDDATARWVAVPASVDPSQRAITAILAHFSLYGGTANKIVDTAPLIDARNVNLHTGAASMGVPIDVPPGRGGLVPGLNFSYDSLRVEEMRLYSSLSSWVGQGWGLGTGSVQIAYDPSGSRYFLEADNYGGEMMQDGTSGGNQVWRLRDEQYARIRTTCNDGSCPWYVTDQSGRQYVFGSDDAHRRWYVESDGTRRYYQLDLSSVQDVLGNQVTYGYWQQYFSDGCTGSTCGNCTPATDIHCYVMAANAQDIYYNYNGATPQTQIHFNLGWDNDNASLGREPQVKVRKDDPYRYTSEPMRCREPDLHPAEGDGDPSPEQHRGEKLRPGNPDDESRAQVQSRLFDLGGELSRLSHLPAAAVHRQQQAGEHRRAR